MKIKKTLTIVMSLFIILCLVGCGTPKDAKAVANVLAKRTSKLSEVVEKLEDVNYNDIVVSQISPLADETFNTVSSKTLSKSKWYSVGGANNSNLAETTSTKPNNAKYVSNKIYDGEKIGIVRPRRTYEPNNISQKNFAQNVAETQDNSVKNQSSYKPKYVNEVSDNFSRNALDKYIANIEVIYNNCADCVSCNAEYKNLKKQLTQNITDCKTLVEKLKDGTIKLTAEEVSSCNSCLDSLNKCTTRLSSTKGNISAKEQTLSKLKDNLTSNVLGIQDAYQKLYEALDNRLDCIKKCNENLCCVSDIINKTNVNMEEAKNNKSDSKDIKDYTKEDEIIKENEDTLLNTENNTNTENKSNVEINNDSTLNNTQTNDQNNSTNNINKSQDNLNSPNKTQTTDNVVKNNNSNNQNPARYIDPVKTYENTNKQNNNQNNNTQNNNNQSNNQNSSQNNLPKTNVQNGTNQTIGNPNNQYPSNTWNNGYNNYGYNGNGYNGNNMPYPPKNIDTYQNIYKNTDTYSPNYVPGNGYNNGLAPNNANNNGQNYNLASNKYKTSLKATAKNEEKANDVKPNENTVSPLPNPFDEKKLEKKDTLDKESGKTMEKTLHNTENSAKNENKTTTMQNKKQSFETVKLNQKNIDSGFNFSGSKFIEKK